jgi:hypothetical protein
MKLNPYFTQLAVAQRRCDAVIPLLTAGPAPGDIGLRRIVAVAIPGKDPAALGDLRVRYDPSANSGRAGYLNLGLEYIIAGPRQFFYFKVVLFVPAHNKSAGRAYTVMPAQFQ